MLYGSPMFCKPLLRFPVCSALKYFISFGRAGSPFVARVLTGLQALVTISVRSSSPPHNCPRRLAWPRTSPFHGGNTGSNPVGDANLINRLRNCRFWRTTGYATVQLLNHSTMSVTLLFRHCFVVDIHRD